MPLWFVEVVVVGDRRGEWWTTLDNFSFVPVNILKLSCFVFHLPIFTQILPHQYS